MTERNVRVVGRYALYGAIAAGGMATVHLGRLLGPVGFSRTVAIKRLHAQFASDPEFVSMFLDEARLAARIRHPNVVPTLDVVATGGELFLVMDYVPGESIARLSRALRERQQTLPPRILSATMAGVLHGLHAAHEAKDERGCPLGIVHRDVSPQNVLIGTDGVPRVLDFGVAKAAGRMQTTREGQIKGKLSYMPPEQLRGAEVSRQTDIYAAGVMLWELVTGQRLFSGDNEGVIVAKVLEGRVEPPSMVLARNRATNITDRDLRALASLDTTILRALSMKVEARFATAREMAIEIERKCPPATASECGDWVENIARDVLSSRAAMIAEIESSASMTVGGQESHVMSVLNARSPLGSSTYLEAPPSNRPSTSSVGPAMVPNLPMPYSSHPAPLDGPPVTQPSSISVSTGSMGRVQHEPSGSRRAVAVLISVMLGASVLASALVYRHSKKVDRVADVPTTDVGLASAPALSSQPPPQPEPIVEPPVVVTTEIDEPVDAGAALAPASPKATGTGKGRGTSSPPKGTAAIPTASPANDDCATPYWYDSSGVKKYKPQCLTGK